jgi:hypothetical protein
MFDRYELYQRRCVQTLIDVLEQVPARWSARCSMAVDDASSGLLLLWTILRGERTFLIRCLEDLGVDMWSFSRAVDESLRRIQKTASPEPWTPPADDSQKRAVFLHLTACTRRWLDRAWRQAQSFGHDFLGIEHLFLALLASGKEPLRSVFSKSGLHYEGVKIAILEAFARPVESDLVANLYCPAARWTTAFVPRSNVPWGARWDKKPAVGLQRRFGTAVLMLHITLFALAFSVIRVLDAPRVYYPITVVFVLGVAIGQIVLFQGAYPRAASVWSGAVLLPLETVLTLIFLPGFSMDERLGGSLCGLMFGVPFGALFGYLSGGLTAGMVLILDRLSAKKGSPQNPPGSIFGGSQKAEPDRVGPAD